jgi:hypothetical protein
MDMDHVVFLDYKSKELESLIKGLKSMIIRGAAAIGLPREGINEGDVLYFINNNGEREVKASGVVSNVSYHNKLSKEESFETIIRHQDKLQLPDKQFYKWAGKSSLMLVDLDDIQEIEPIQIIKYNAANIDGWLPVGNIEKVLDGQIE